MASTLPEGGTPFAFIPIIPLKGEGKPIYFRALVSSIQDSYSPQWGEHMDMGRADPKFMYNQFSRTINLEFKIASVKTNEHKEHMNSMNSLASLVYPIYKVGKGFNGVYVKFYIGDFIETIGIINSLNFTINNETPWIDDLPLIIDCSLTLRCIGKNKPNYKKPTNDGPYYDGIYKQGFQK